MRNEILQEPYLHPSVWNGRSLHHTANKAYASTVREYLAKNTSPCPVPPPPLQSGASRVSSLDRDLFLQRFSPLAAQPDGDPSRWPPVRDKAQELALLLRSIRGLHYFLLRPLLYLVD
jgi:hypothetical protein